MPRRRGGPHTRVVNGRITTWARMNTVLSLAANGNYNTSDLLAGFKAAGGTQQGATILRTHLNMSVTTGVAANDFFTWGLIRGQDVDAGANIAGAPTPDLHPYDDWLFWRNESAASGAAYWEGNGNYKQWDIRSKRKLADLQMQYQLVVKRNTVASATLGLSITTSVLLLLP